MFGLHQALRLLSQVVLTREANPDTDREGKGLVRRTDCCKLNAGVTASSGVRSSGRFSGLVDPDGGIGLLRARATTLDPIPSNGRCQIESLRPA
jgi:hypothetical protein